MGGGTLRADGRSPRLGSRLGGSAPLPLLSSSSSSSPWGRNRSPRRAGRSPPGSHRDATGTGTAQSCLTCLQPCPGSLRAAGVRTGLGVPAGVGSSVGARVCRCARSTSAAAGAAPDSPGLPPFPAPAAGAGDGKPPGSGSVGSGLTFGLPGSVPGRALARFPRRKAEAGCAVQSGFRRSRRLRSNCSCCSACAAGPAQA